MGFPKALLEYRSETFLGRLVRVYSRVAAPVIVVLGHEPERIRAAAAGAMVVVNARHDLGMLTSLQCGLRAVPPDLPYALFTPVDYATVDEETVRAIAEADHALLAIPRNDSRRGHPVRIARELIPEFLALPVSAQARDLIHGHVDRTIYLDVDDPGIHLDCDTPEDYRRLVGSAS